MQLRFANRLWLQIALFCFAILTSTASAVLASDEMPATPALTSRTYGTQDGLPSSIIYALAQDRNGYLWIGGPGGLMRFDGVQFVTWGTHGEPPLPFGEVRSLLADKDGSLWIGFTEAGVVSRIAGNHLRTYTTQDGLPDGPIHPHVQDRDGTVWAAGSGGITAFHGDKWEQRQGRDGLPAAAVDNVFEDRSGSLWVSTAAGIFRRDRGQQQFRLIDRGLASSISEDPQGRLWLIHPQQGIRLLPTALTGEPDRRPALRLTGTTMLGDRSGHLWVGSGFRAGLVLVSVDPRTARLTERPLLDDKVVVSLLEDSDGSIWAGTSGGLLRFYEPKGQTFSRANGLPDDSVRAIASTADGRLWLGTASGLTQVTAHGSAETTRIPGVSGRSVTSIHADRSGSLWIGFADSGLGVLTGGRFSAVATPGNAPLENVITVRPDADGGLWLCNLRDLGLYYGRTPSLFTKVQGAFHSGRGGCSATLLDDRGRVWIGFDDGTIMVKERDGPPRFLRDDALHGRVCAIHEDQDNSIWVATTEGLSRYRDGRFRTLTAKNGLPGNYFTAVIEDEHGDLWVCANSGILRLTKAEFERTASDPEHRVRYTLYDASDGIRDTPVCYGEPHAVRDREGKLWFTSLNGAVIVDPIRFREPAATLTPRIERVVADDVVLAGDSPSLAAGTARVELNYTAVSLSAASKIRFQYRLDGFDTSWVDAGSRRQAFYTNLAPGPYRFEVRASLDDAVAPATMYQFAVRPAFYQTRTFYLASAAMAALCLWGFWQLRVRALHRRYALIMNERARIGREIHDTVLQNMAGVALEIEGVARQLPTAGSPLGDGLARISSDIKEHIAEVRHTIWELRTPEEGAATLERALREAGDRIVGGRGPTQFELAIIGTPRAWGRDVERELIRIAREALRNAVRHASAHAIRIELHYADDALRLVITDDGRGFNVEAHLKAESQHWGLLGMSERASRISAAFDIRSRAGAGTTIDVIVRQARAGR